MAANNLPTATKMAETVGNLALDAENANFHADFLKDALASGKTLTAAQKAEVRKCLSWMRDGAATLERVLG